VQFSKVVNGGLELPLAAAQLKPAHAEATGILAVLDANGITQTQGR
jgi:hypothetical protein